MSWRDMSQKPPEVTSDRFRLERVQSSTSSARREEDALLPPLAGRGRGRLGGTRLGRVDVVGGSSSQTGQSLTVDPTQYQHQQHYGSINRRRINLIMRSLNNIILMSISSISMRRITKRIISISLILSRSSLILSSLRSRCVGVRLMGCRLWSRRPDRRAMEGGLLRPRFYLTSVNMWHAGYESMPM